MQLKKLITLVGTACFMLSSAMSHALDLSSNNFGISNGKFQGKKNGSFRPESIYVGFGIWTDLSSAREYRAKVGMANISLTYTCEQQFGATFSYHSTRTKVERPDDYIKANTTLFLIISISDHSDADIIDNYSLRFRKTFSTNKNARFSLEAGPSYVQGTITRYEPQEVIEEWDLLFLNYSRTSNYKTIKEDSQAIGASIKASLEIPIGKIVGIEIGLRSEINPIKSYLAFNFGIGLGLYAN